MPVKKTVLEPSGDHRARAAEARKIKCPRSAERHHNQEQPTMRQADASIRSGSVGRAVSVSASNGGGNPVGPITI